MTEPIGTQTADLFKRGKSLEQVEAEEFVKPVEGRERLDRFISTKYGVHPEETNFEEMVLKEQLDEIDTIVRDRGISQETMNEIKIQHPELFELESNYFSRELLIQGLERIPVDDVATINKVINANSKIVNQALDDPQDFRRIVDEMKTRYQRQEIGQEIPIEEVEFEVRRPDDPLTIEESMENLAEIEPIQPESVIPGIGLVVAPVVAAVAGAVGIGVGKYIYDKMHQETKNVFAEDKNGQ